MSVVICYSCDFFSMIATDTRISYGRSLGDIIYYEDNQEKLYNVENIGWVGGAGAHKFIDIMKRKLSETEIKYSNQIKELFLESYNEVVGLDIYDNKTLDVTGIAASWIGYNSEISQLPLFRVGIFSNSTVSEAAAVPMLEKNMIYILFPYEYLENPAMVHELEQSYKMNYVFDGDHFRFIHHISCIFKEITNNSKSVSDICDIGIMNIDTNGVYKIRIKENIDKLISDYKNKYSNIEFNVIWSSNDEDA